MIVADLPPIFYRVLALVFGALWGSFFNVAIYRWPRDMSVVSPPSHCPACGAAVPWYRNLPILAFALQRGRAACCGAKMTPRYLLVEILGAVIALAVMERTLRLAGVDAPITPTLLEALTLFVFGGALLVAAFIDLEHMIIPDEVTLPGAALGLATVALRPDLDAADAALGAGVGYLTVQVLFVWSYEAVTGRRGMGEGDSKLLLLIGAFVGWQGSLFALVGGAMQGLVVAILAIALRRRMAPADEVSDDQGPFNQPGPVEARCEDREGAIAPLLEEPAEVEAAEESEEDEEPLVAPRKLPFGPFLALAALEWLFFGPTILDWYVGLFMTP
ncbi:MAG: prepilin peptidase [Sandaracinus sp.]|nr:prepilin peptidase [Sandaracinus sp.]